MLRRFTGIIGSCMIFMMIITACSSSSAVEKTIFVAPQKVECVGVAPQECFLIRENPEEDWQFWYDSIEGFDFVPGFMYELKVDEVTNENPPADSSSVSLELVEIINQEPVAIKTIYIGPERVECEGEGPQLCYQYKEDPDGDWLLYYNEIEGFEYESGYIYELLVAETQVENPPAGGSATQLTLVEVVNKVEAPPSLIGTIWAATAIGGSEVIDGSDVVMGIAEGRIGGFSGCNTYFGPYEANGSSVVVGPLATTRLACNEELMNQERAFLSSLEETSTYELSGDTLQVKNNSGDTLVTFTVMPPTPLEVTPWELVTYNDGNQAMVSVLAGTRITALFEAGNISGSAGCNNYSGSYEVDGNAISIGPLAGTLAFCNEPEGVMEQESSYLAALESTATYQIVVNRLELISESGELMATFRVAESTGIEGITWNIIGYNNGRGGVVSVVLDTEINALFEDGTVSGSAGCNSYTASYEIVGSSITIGPVATTRKICNEPEGVMEQENEFLAALQSAVEYTIDGNRLDMFNADGARALNASASE